MRLVSSLFIYLFISYFIILFNPSKLFCWPPLQILQLNKQTRRSHLRKIPPLFDPSHPSPHSTSSDSQPNVRVYVGATRVRRLFRAQWAVSCICLRLAAFNQLASARALLFNQVSQTINSHQIGNLSSSPCSCRRVLAANARSDPEWQSPGRDLVHNLKTNVKRLRFTG